jgi:hypothetical protein
MAAGHGDGGWWAKLDAAGCHIVTGLRGNTPPRRPTGRRPAWASARESGPAGARGRHHPLQPDRPAPGLPRRQPAQSVLGPDPPTIRSGRSGCEPRLAESCASSAMTSIDPPRRYPASTSAALRGLLTAFPPGIGSSVSWRMMADRAVLPLDQARPEDQAFVRCVRECRAHPDRGGADRLSPAQARS